MSRHKKVATSKYKGVCKVTCNDNKPWLMRININGLTSMKRYVNEVDAAKAYDILCLRHGIPASNFYTKKI